jgi:hypothetical protein
MLLPEVRAVSEALQRYQALVVPTTPGFPVKVTLHPVSKMLAPTYGSPPRPSAIHGVPVAVGATREELTTLALAADQTVLLPMLFVAVTASRM